MRREFRPSPETLEGRSLLSAVATSRVLPRAGVETLSLDVPAVVSQFATATAVTLHRSPVALVGSRSGAATSLDNSLTVEVSTRANPPGPTPGSVNRQLQALPHLQYWPVDTFVTFAPGESSKTISIPIIAGAVNPGEVALNVQAVPVRDGTPTSPDHPSAQPTDSTLLIVDHADVVQPRLVSTHLIITGRDATGIALTFSRPMDPASVTRPSLYAVKQLAAKYNAGDVAQILFFFKVRSLKPTVVAIKSVSYDAATNTVILTPAHHLKPGAKFEVGLNPGYTPGSPYFRDAAGNPLAAPNVGPSIEDRVDVTKTLSAHDGTPLLRS